MREISLAFLLVEILALSAVSFFAILMCIAQVIYFTGNPFDSKAIFDVIIAILCVYAILSGYKLSWWVINGGPKSGILIGFKWLLGIFCGLLVTAIGWILIANRIFIFDGESLLYYAATTGVIYIPAFFHLCAETYIQARANNSSHSAN